MKRFILLIGFLTRLPVPTTLGFDEYFYKSAVYFPVVGAILGSIYYVCAAILQHFLPSFLVAILVTLLTVLLTGGLHLDGVADSFDGLFSYRKKDQILEIMKDSRIGTNGVLALFFVLLLKVGFLSMLFDKGVYVSVFMMPVFARYGQIILCYRAHYARENGMGQVFIGKITNTLLMQTTLYLVLVGIAFHLFYLDNILLDIFFLPVLFISVFFIRRISYRKIEGITGDIVGCTCEIIELVYIIYFAFFIA